MPCWESWTVTPPPKKFYLLNFTIQFSRINLLSISENERKMYLLQERRRRRKNGHTHAKEQPFTVINNNNKKCMARNYAQSPFQVTAHQQAGHSESLSPLGAALMYPVFFRNYILAWDLWAASWSFPDTLLMGETVGRCQSFCYEHPPENAPQSSSDLSKSPPAKSCSNLSCFPLLSCLNFEFWTDYRFNKVAK